ncbi:MAG: hypothetical protein IT406_03440 [Candidatus Yanofskybacteria bacterium]|nr:hypothetical protein [Candidatus Yanofskybacteria bacterium]
MSVLVVALAATQTTIVHAGVSYYYSPLCLGSLVNSRYAEGPPETGGDPAQFTGENSAQVQNTSGQIYCGRFASSDAPSGDVRSIALRIAATTSDALRGTPPVEVFDGTTLDGFDASGVFIPPQETDSAPEGESPVASGSEAPALVPVEEPSPIATSSLPEETPLSIEPVVLDPVISPFESPVPSDTAQPPAASPFVEEPAVVPTQEPVLEPEPAPEPSAFLKWLFPVAHAGEIASDSASLDEVFTVRYSIDGATWIPAGSVKRGQTSDIRFDLPTEAFEALDNFQVAIFTGLGLETSTLYVDSIWLEVEYDSPIVSFIGDVAATIVDAIIPEEAPSTSADALATPTPTPKVKRLVWEFGSLGSEVSTEQELPWYPSGASSADASGPAKGELRISGDHISLSGSCTETHFVVLVFRGKEDYVRDPASALYNAALPCDSGLLSYEMSSLPVPIEDGTYWLMIGQQGRGPWEPISSLYPVRITVREVEE